MENNSSIPVSRLIIHVYMGMDHYTNIRAEAQVSGPSNSQIRIFDSIR